MLKHMSPWSWAGLGVWLARAGVLALFATVLVFGPQLEDRAWDCGVHVTPAQAAMHTALTAEGFTHHHHLALLASHIGKLAARGDSLQTPAAGITWGSAFTQALQPEAPAASPHISTFGVIPEAAPPAAPVPSPTDPPPQIW
jgi:hypothetical protein